MLRRNRRSTVYRSGRASRTLAALSSAACIAWLAVTPSAAAGGPERQQRWRDSRPAELCSGPLDRRGSDLLMTLSVALAKPAASPATAESCDVLCVGCAGAVIGLLGSTAAIGASCGGAIFSGGLTLVGCWISITTGHGMVLATAANCARCDRCLDEPDPDTPPRDGGATDPADDCEPCDPTDPLMDCPDPEDDPCREDPEDDE